MSKEIREFYHFDEFHLDPARRLVLRGDQPVPVTSKVFETLLVLVRNRDRVLPKEELMNAVWPDSFVEEVNLAQNISALRKALGEAPGENKFIATIPGKGYRFVCEVRAPDVFAGELIVARHTRAEVTMVEEKEDEIEALGNQLPAGPLALPAPRRFVFVEKALASILLALVLCLAAAGFHFWRRKSVGISPPTPHSLAVLPFQPLGGGTDDDHLGLGVADAVITKLSNIRELPVRPTDVVIRYGDSKDPLQAARELGVDSVLSGKIQKSGDRLRVTVQLVRVQDGQTLWAQTFDERTMGIFAVEDSISERVVEALAVNLGSQEKLQLARHYTENIVAYRDYLAGLYSEFTFTRDGMNKAIDYFSRAIASDPSYALAYAGLADAYTTESDWLLAPREALPRAESAARKALAFDDNLAEAHGALAHALLHEWRLAESEREFHAALALNPQSVSTYFAYGEYLASIGRPDLAIAQGQMALTIDPLSPEINSFLPWDYYLERDYAQCLTTAQKAIQMFPEFWVPHMTAGMCYYAQSQFPEAIQEYTKALAMNPESTYAQAGLGMSYARSGNRSEAYRAIEKLKSMAKDTYVSPAYIAVVYQVLGNIDSEFAWYARAYDDRAEWLLWLTVDPIYDNQRNDPRFQDLVKRVGVAQQTGNKVIGSVSSHLITP
jgi:DNA-binding winged helix-turn-helix (wHTH) protein/TolB-like protein/Tfp pilus assembly protein PilF